MRRKFGKLSLNYEEAGSGRPVVMLHGWPLDLSSMKGAMEPVFAGRAGWKRIYVDLPGMGKSDAPGWLTTQDQVLEAVSDFIDTVIPGRRFCAAGLSYGGFLAQGLVCRMGDRMDGAMFLVPALASLDRTRVPARSVIHEEPVEYGGLSERDVEAFKEMAVVRTQAHLDAWKTDIFPGISAANGAFLGILGRTCSFDVEKLPRPFPAPSLFMFGRQDSTVGYRDVWGIFDSYPRASLAILDRAGHGLQMEQPVLFRALVREWLDRVEEYAAGSAAGAPRPVL
jgi:pimeloyl-ACP methyl ester carboxylesterase